MKKKKQGAPPRASRRYVLHLEGDGKRDRLRVTGVARFLVCERHEMRLAIGRGVLTVRGRELDYLVFGGGALEIMGDIAIIEKEGAV